MAKNSKLNSTKKRVKVKDLPESEKKMSGKELKKVKGGLNESAGIGAIAGGTSGVPVKPGENISSPRDASSGLCSSKRS